DGSGAIADAHPRCRLDAVDLAPAAALLPQRAREGGGARAVATLERLGDAVVLWTPTRRAERREDRDVARHELRDLHALGVAQAAIVLMPETDPDDREHTDDRERGPRAAIRGLALGGSGTFRRRLARRHRLPAAALRP